MEFWDWVSNPHASSALSGCEKEENLNAIFEEDIAPIRAKVTSSYSQCSFFIHLHSLSGILPSLPEEFAETYY